MSYIGKAVKINEGGGPSHVKSYSTKADFQAAINAGLVELNEPGYIIDEGVIYYNSQESSRITEYATVAAIYAAAANGIEETYRLTWSGDPYVPDGEVVGIITGGEVVPSPFESAEIPASVIGKMWTVEGDALLTYDADGRPVMTPTVVNGNAHLVLDTVRVNRFDEIGMHIDLQRGGSSTSNRVGIIARGPSAPDRRALGYLHQQSSSSFNQVLYTNDASGAGNLSWRSMAGANAWSGRLSILGGTPYDGVPTYEFRAISDASPDYTAVSRAGTSDHGDILAGTAPDWEICVFFTGSDTNGADVLTVLSVQLRR